MPTLTAKLALAGDPLRPVENALIEYDRDGTVVNIEEAPDVVKDPDHDVVIPAPFDAHVHAADWMFRHAGLGKPLREIVAPPNGLKHRLLKETPETALMSSVRSFLETAFKLGCVGVADFREGGVEGVKTGVSAAEGLAVEYIPMGRPTSDDPEEVERELEEISRVTEFLGLPDVHMPDDVLEVIGEFDVRVYVHVNEDPSSVKRCLRDHGTTEVERALEFLEPEGLVHLTVLTERDLEALEDSSVRVVVACPRSNSYFGVGEPDLNVLKRLPQTLLLGTDNGMALEPDPLEEARYAWLRGLPPSRALRAVTIDAAEVFGSPTLVEGRPLGALGLDGTGFPWDRSRRESACAHALQAVKWAELTVYVGDEACRVTGS